MVRGVIHVKDGEIMMEADADPGCRDAVLETASVLRQAEDDVGARLGVEVKQFVN